MVSRKFEVKPVKLLEGAARIKDCLPESIALQLSRKGVTKVVVCPHSGIGQKLTADGRYRCVKCGEALGR